MRIVTPMPQEGGPRIPQNLIFLKNGKNHPTRDTPLDQRSLIHRERGFRVDQEYPKSTTKQKKIARPLETTSKQKCSNVRPLLSNTFPQKFRIS